VIISDPPTSTDPAPTPPPPTTPLSPLPEPAPIAGLGYTQRFGDDFDTLDRTTWCSHQWWEPNAPTGSQTVANGELRLRRERSSGYANTTMTTEPCGQANPKSFQYGYFEARMKYETVQGNGPAFWLFSTRHATNPAWPNVNPVCAQNGLPKAECLSAEMDVFEGFGRINYGGARTDDFFSGTLHRNSCGCYGEANQSRFVQKGTGLDLSQYHTYAVKWTASQITYYIDGVAQGSVAPFDSTGQPMHLLLYNWTTGWEDENVPNSSTEPELDVFVDWVRVWQQ
jgi:beta-glucanase (GH16 family)